MTAMGIGQWVRDVAGVFTHPNMDAILEPKIIEPSWLDLGMAACFILLLIALARLKRVGSEWEFLVAAIRMTIQLFLVGFVLTAVFTVQNPWIIGGILVFMAGFAVRMISKRIKNPFPGLTWIVALAIFVGCGAVTLAFNWLILRIDPLFNPRYLIPITGMVFGNSMNGLALGAERLSSELRNRVDEVETALALGASMNQAARPMVRAAFRAAIIPIVNNMSAMGIVFLPGMMTGQILSGTSPVTAVTYQIAIMFAIAGSVTLSSFIIVQSGYRRFFTRDHQLRGELVR